MTGTSDARDVSAYYYSYEYGGASRRRRLPWRRPSQFTDRTPPAPEPPPDPVVEPEVTGTQEPAASR